ncbi:tRNA 5-methoxyuridine(34)/uridine 5-oxyacetic acid(34) synthase CmoB [SAR86 cluster bacterium]|nr:tRNA 5-methoxyuridine(34)/uridine 5-oxyacetic acid(34) synthase CmoB [SAR86 cluster bacterium]
MFISKEVEALYYQYRDNPFGNKKDRRIESWLEILGRLPTILDAEVELINEINIDLDIEDTDEIESLLLKLMPWRKGPFRINDIFIDSEWDSSKKWKRFQKLNIDLDGKSILDVGSGNGYYAFRMLGLGADKVLCLEPNLVHVSQFSAINHFVKSENIRMIPERIEESGLKNSKFDLIFSMGLLYHQRNPPEHLNNLKELLSDNGKLVLETIISPKECGKALEPSNGKYASMPNVHFVHTDNGCKSIFRNLSLQVYAESDLVVTDDKEQRTTKWMPFKSFESALNLQNKSITIEGYPAPKRKFYVLGKAS